MQDIVTSLQVHGLTGSSRGLLRLGAMSFPCALGRSGRQVLKREGDGTTPTGRFKLLQVYYRADRVLRPQTVLPVTALRKTYGWCDAVGDRNYNRLINLPYAASHEELMRADSIYDIIVTTSHNRAPRVQGLGSAVFFHLARPDFSPTQGCVSVSLAAMRTILAHCGRHTELLIAHPS